MKPYRSLLGTLAIGLVFGLSGLGGCCDDQDIICSGVTTIKAAVAGQVGAICGQGTPEQQSMALSKLQDDISKATAAISGALEACRRGDEEAARKLIEKIPSLDSFKGIVGSKILRQSDGTFANEYPVLTPGASVSSQYISAPTEQSPVVLVSINNGDPTAPAAAGSLLLAGGAQDPSNATDPLGTIAPLGTPSVSAVSEVSFTYPVPPSTMFTYISERGVQRSLPVTGSIRLSRFRNSPAGSHSVPLAFNWTIGAGDNQFVFSLDVENPNNKLVVNSAGFGTLSCALRLSGPVANIALKFVPERVWMTLPVSISPGTSNIAFGSGGFIDGTQLFPIRPETRMQIDQINFPIDSSRPPEIPGQPTGGGGPTTSGNGNPTTTSGNIPACNRPFGPTGPTQLEIDTNRAFDSLVGPCP